MVSPIFLDANIPIYAAGRAHPLKDPCTQILVLAARQPQAFVTDAEVLQELLHYYLSRGRWPQGQTVVEAFAIVLSGRVEAIEAGDVLRAVALAATFPRLSARDLLHVAVMDRLSVTTIASADQDFVEATHIHRLDPGDFATWQQQIVGAAAP